MNDLQEEIYAQIDHFGAWIKIFDDLCQKKIAA